MSTNTLRLTFHTDPGHGWLEVHRPLAVKLGIASKISPYSYRSHDGDTYYLEEDCDAGLFMDAAKAAGYVVNIVERNSPNADSFIRTLRRVTA
jgi:hypothetical protein